MNSSEMRDEAAMLLRAVRTERGERRDHMIEEARLWIALAEVTGAEDPDMPVPADTVMRIHTRTGALTVVRETKEIQVTVYPWICLGCGEGRQFGRASRTDAREEATLHARDCWVLPEPTAPNPNDAIPDQASRRPEPQRS
ncbi:hypothetical protein ACFY6U_50525 [Streptomyces sp. NPDC013157]|uniref:hypothetical protein n=1 Tax=Streptomyces sp. NPDC013157 TaxID=3364861 RepID=UPI0036CA25BF